MSGGRGVKSPQSATPAADVSFTADVQSWKILRPRTIRFNR